MSGLNMVARNCGERNVKVGHELMFHYCTHTVFILLHYLAIQPNGLQECYNKIILMLIIVNHCREYHTYSVGVNIRKFIIRYYSPLSIEDAQLDVPKKSVYLEWLYLQQFFD